MTRKEATSLLKSRVDLIKSNYPEIDDYCEALKMAIEALKQGTCKDWKFYYRHGYAQAKKDLLCDDCISRQAVLEWCGDINMDVYTNEVKEFVLSLPLVTPQPKIGHWINDGLYAESHSHKAFHCSKCGHNVLGFKEDLSNYCPNCGAKMVEPQESEVKDEQT